MASDADRAERLIEHVLAALNAADPAGLVAILGEAEDPPDPEFGADPHQEYRIEAEAIARGIRHEEVAGEPLNERQIAPIVRSVLERQLEVRPSRGEARRISEAILAWRLFDLIGDTVAEAAAAPLAEGRAVLHRHQRYADEFPAIELTPKRETAAQLLISIDFDAQVTCMVTDGNSHEIFSPVPAEIAAEVRDLVTALVAGTYYEEIRDKPRSTTTKAIWPAGESSRLDVTKDAGGPLTEWRKRAYDPY